MEQDRSTIARKLLEAKEEMVHPLTGKKETHSYEDWIMIHHPKLKAIRDTYKNRK